MDGPEIVHHRCFHSPWFDSMTKSSVSQTLRVPISGLTEGPYALEAGTARYVTRVHRLRAGDTFLVFDPEQGLEGRARLLTDGAPVTCEVGELRVGERPGLSQLRLVQALGKADKPERVIRDATALGVGRITFVQSERSVVKLTPRSASKLERWKSLALEAARQSLRTDLPLLDEPVPLESYLKSPPRGPEWVLQPEGTTRLSALAGNEQPITLFIGPEGGFSPEEQRRFVQRGAQLVSLGPWVLRTELAATAALTLVVHAQLARVP
ncbi:MAG: hypothetical protein RJA70_2119 [Pseudomonadota bacterium]|jgi:16S rRNA (uracil1498-N3)-methyltransferase